MERWALQGGLCTLGTGQKRIQMIYVVQNPKDTTVSFYHFDWMNLIQPETGPWEEYIHKFNTRQLANGSW
ncbi:cytosolic sulfotransferase 1-like isoform X1 [Arapaima gigas]